MMHTRKEIDGSIVIDIPYPIWEQLMNQGKEVEILLILAKPAYVRFQRTEGQWFNNIHYWYGVDLDLDLDLDHGLKKNLELDLDLDLDLDLELDLDFWV